MQYQLAECCAVADGGGRGDRFRHAAAQRDRYRNSFPAYAQLPSCSYRDTGADGDGQPTIACPAADCHIPFLANLVTRYAGLVDAYEIWKSPNLVKYWTVPVYSRPRERTADGDYGIPDGDGQPTIACPAADCHIPFLSIPRARRRNALLYLAAATARLFL